MVPIFQMRKLRLRDLIKLTQLSMWKAKHKPRVTVLKLCVFAPHPLGVVGGDLEAMLTQKKTIFTFKLKKVRKTTRTFSYDLNQIPYDYIVEMKKRFKGLDQLAWRTVDGGLQHCCEVAIKTILNKNKCKKAKWLPEEALKIAEKIREVKGKWERERYTQWNADFQRIARRDKKVFISE